MEKLRGDVFAEKKRGNVLAYIKRPGKKQETEVIRQYTLPAQLL